MGIALSILTSNDQFNIETTNFAELHALTKKRFANRYAEELLIRKNNLIHLVRELNSASINYWIIGKTLLGFSTSDNFIPDHDDDIGIDISQLIPFCLFALPALLNKGFRLIRVDPNDQMISIYRDGRYIDICIFTKKGSNGYGYSGKSYPLHYFEPLKKYCLSANEKVNVPHGHLEICSLKYPNFVNYLLSSFLVWEHGINHVDSMLKIINDKKHFSSMVSVKHFKILSSFLEDFANLIYCKEIVPNHIYDKTRFLRSMRKV